MLEGLRETKEPILNPVSYEIEKDKYFGMVVEDIDRDNKKEIILGIKMYYKFEEI